MNILVTGATGLIGKKVGQLLVKNGHTIVAVTRDIERAKRETPFPATWIQCDLQKEKIPLNSGTKIDGVIHLAGESVGDGKWTKEQKAKILESRTVGTRNLLASFDNSALKFLVSASAMGFYGESHSPLSEDAPPGQGFLSEVTQAWEKEVSSVGAETRVCLFRISVVLSTEGGALPKMLFPAQIFASSALGSGTQWLSWIHIDDVARAFVFAVENESMRGPYNLAAPSPVQQKEMAREIAAQIGSFNGPPVPTFALRLMLGEQASLALISLNVSSKKLQQASFAFLYPDLSSALKNLLAHWKNGVAVKKFEQYFDMPRERVFEFFAKAENLEKITPQFLNFHILKTSTEKIQEGTLIDYSLKIRGIPLTWKTRIESWQPPNEFVDVQLKGPYSVWHHTHKFEDLGSGTLMTDIIRYKLPLGLPGRLVAQAYIDNDVDSIFRHRREVVSEYL